jgi:hypothetical protein
MTGSMLSIPVPVPLSRIDAIADSSGGERALEEGMGVGGEGEGEGRQAGALKLTWGMLDVERRETFELLLFRATRGNAIMRVRVW